MQAAQRLGAQGAAQGGGKERAKEAEPVFAGVLPQGCEGLVADAATRAGHGAQERRVVVAVAPEAQPGTQVAYLGTVKKALSARDLVRDIGLAQRFFERLGLVVGAVEHGKVAKGLELGARLRQGALGT